MTDPLPDATQPPIPSPREARTRAGLTVAEVSVRSGVSISLIQRCERLGRWPLTRLHREQYQATVGIHIPSPPGGSHA